MSRKAGTRWRLTGLGLRVTAGATLCAVGVMTTISSAGAAPGTAQKTFVNGDVTAISQALQVEPKTGGFAFTITVGTSIADYRDTLAQASSQSLDLGLLGTALTTQQCNGSNPALKSNQIPQPLVAESDRGNQHRAATTGPSASSGVLAAAGNEAVTATTQPSADASFDGGTLGIPGVATMTGFSSAGATQLDGQTREATSTAQIHQLSLAGGQVVLHNLIWTATQRTGARTGSSGGFHVGALTVAGKQEQPTGANLAKAFVAVNHALASTGLHVDQPSVKQHGAAVLVSPLTVGIDNSQVGHKLVSPLLTKAQPVTDALTNALLGISCQFGSPLTVADLVLGTADGTGSTDLMFGGASVGTQVIASRDPFGTPHLGSPPSRVPAGRVGSSPPPRPGAGSSRGASPAAPPATTGKAAGKQPAVAAPVAATTTTCSSTSTAHWPSCSTGDALGVGLIALGVLALVGGGDFAVLRRRRLPNVSL